MAQTIIGAGERLAAATRNLMKTSSFKSTLNVVRATTLTAALNVTARVPRRTSTRPLANPPWRSAAGLYCSTASPTGLRIAKMSALWTPGAGSSHGGPIPTHTMAQTIIGAGWQQAAATRNLMKTSSFKSTLNVVRATTLTAALNVTARVSGRTSTRPLANPSWRSAAGLYCTTAGPTG